LAEGVRRYSNVVLPDIVAGTDEGDAPTLDEQAAGGIKLLLARDQDKPVRVSRLTPQQRTLACELFTGGMSLTAIARRIGISWDSVGRILDDAGLRAMPNRRW
jgi:DNA-binding NarL/FixJ family response regulator